MAKIQFGLKSADAIQQNFKIIFDRLVRGYKSVMGKNPEGLDLIKIRFEAAEKARDSAKVVDRGGMTLDPNKPIMGGTQEGAALRSGIMRATGARPKTLIEEAIDDASPGFSGDRKVDAELVAENLAERMGKVYDDMPTKERIKLYDEAFTGLSKKKFDPEGKADGGRIGFKKGMDRRTFMKIMGGLASIPVLGKFFKGAEVAAPVVEKVVETSKGVPPYFFSLVNKIKLLGEPRRTPSYKERVNEYQYTGKDGIEYELVEDLDTGEIIIQKDKIGGANFGDETYEVIEDRTEMRYKKGQGDETTQGTPADEYEEYKVEFDQDGTVADATEIDELSRKEIIEEVSAGGGKSKIKKAGGGLAYMLGE